MEPHRTDPIALIAGLFFGLAGLAVFANQQWDDVDVTAFTAAGVMLIGLLLLGLVVVRFVQTTDATATPEELVTEAADSES